MSSIEDIENHLIKELILEHHYIIELDITHKNIIDIFTNFDYLSPNISYEKLIDYFPKQAANLYKNQLIQYMKKIESVAQTHDFHSIQIEFQTNKRYFLPECKWALIKCNFKCEADGSIHAYLLCKDMTKIKEKELSLKDSSQKDSLTGIYNKRWFYIQSTNLIQNIDKDKDSLALFFIDLDNFKNANDSHGHLFGDEIIAKFAKALKDIFTKLDVVGRYGGDEFVVLSTYAHAPYCLGLIGDQIVEAAHNLKLSVPEYQVTVSIGISRYPVNGIEINDLMLNADRALYTSKFKGKDQFTIYDVLNKKDPQIQLMNAQFLAHKSSTSCIDPSLINTEEI